MQRLRAALVTVFFIAGCFFISGCQTFQQAQNKGQQDVKIDPDTVYPQGIEAK